MKICNTCKKDLDLVQFSKSSKKSDGLSPICKPCKKVYQDSYYSENKDSAIAKAYNRKRALIDFVWSIKQGKQCVDCGESDPVVLEFDHLGDKSYNVSEMPARGFSKANILAEIAKCEVVCCNCHRRRTHSRGGWRRNIVVKA